ncbi:asparagine synthetase B family protein [Thiospirillum jenense]|uniref:asparagine synthase (glutamine-hydrolyzing) n=1 Tax=Thiospirillum jenense TaxID=1653858 RepID=A0A839HDP2_9GAMM|nr:asparagine synthase C-terminal domain-containing protein [Thiospirillum jenense]MBB1125368.1 asparagine synthase [Thiospirillum jenense]
MYDFFGWVTPPAQSDTAQSECIRRLLQHCRNSRQPIIYQDAISTVVTVGQLVDVVMTDDVLVMVAGRPRITNQAESAHIKNPAAAILALWQQYELNLFEKLLGSFALIIINRRTGATVFAIDRIGIQTLAFAVTHQGLVFSNRADLVAAHPFVAAQLSPQAIFNYFYFFKVPAPQTIFQGVEKLLPAEFGRYSNTTLTRSFYWQLHYQDAPRRDIQAQTIRFRQLFKDTIQRASNTDKVAAFLSGGTDSSAVAGILTDIQGQGARTYSIGFNASGFDEMEYARIATRHFNLDAREYYLSPQDVVDTIPIIAANYDEPFANESAVSAYFCAKLAAADGYQVMLGGDGGDEIFGGNARYARQRIFEYYQWLPFKLRHSVLEPLADLPLVMRLPLIRKFHAYVSKAKTPLPQRLEAFNYLYRQPLTDMFSADFLAAIDPKQPDLLLKDPYERADSQHYINRMLHLDLKLTLADDDLRKVTTMANVAGVEVRYPLLDDDMVAFSGEVPPNWKVRGLTLRWFYKTALRGYLPDTILDKRKHGFGLPFGIWLKEYLPLKERVNDRLSDFKRRGWLRADYIDQVQASHLQDHAIYFGKLLWVMLILEEWLEQHQTITHDI